MNFGGHLITGWLISRAGDFNINEKRFITLMAVAPDIDAFSFIYPKLLGDWHRTFGHNIFFGVLVPLLVFAFFRRARAVKVLPFAFLAMFSHYVLDLAVTGWWAFYPLWPLSNYAIITSTYIPEYVMKYFIQVGLEVVLGAVVVLIYLRTKTTFLEIFSSNFDRFITTFIISPFKYKCAECNARAFYKCEECGEYFCGKHIKFGSGFTTKCREKQLRIKN